MAKRTTPEPGSAGSAHPDPAPGAAMTEPTPAPSVPDAAADVAETEPGQVDAVPTQAAEPAAPTPGAWPDVSTDPGEPRCPWCSAVLSSPDLATCPSCGAQLNGPSEAEVPGVTTIDVAALAWKAGAPPRRNKLMSWISGEAEDEPPASVGSSSAIEPPSLAVRREMLRLELEAEGISLPHDAEPSADEELTAGESAADQAPAGETPPADEGSPEPGSGSPTS